MRNNDGNNEGMEEEYEDLEHEAMAMQSKRPEVDSGNSAVAAAPAKNMLIMIMLAGVLFAAVYYSFFSGPSTPKEQTVKATPTTVAPPSAEIAVATPKLPTLPEPPALTPPKVPEPAPLPAPEVKPAALPAPEIPVANKLLPPETAKGGPDLSSREARLKSGIILGSKGSAGDAAKEKDKKISKLDDPYFIMQHTNAPQAAATKIGATDYVIAEGKIIDAVLESAINTDVPGAIRAIVSRDVYAETSKNILIPKGSRLIGGYAGGDLKRGQSRIGIVWKRVIRPDGIDVAIDSDGADQIGRAGLNGEADNHFLELFGNAFMFTVMNVSTGVVADALSTKLTNQVNKAVNNPTPTTSSGSTVTQTQTIDPATGQTSVTSTATPGGAALQDSVNTIGSMAKDISKEYLQVKPTVTVDQGTRIKVFVRRDLVFPANLQYGVKLVN